MHLKRWALIGALALGGACAGEADRGRFRVKRYDRDAIDRSLTSDQAGILMGVFPLKKGGVVDGDTIKVGGLDNTLRLLGMDTEETFKKEADRRLYESGWERYLAAKQAETTRPIKVATPMGEEAAQWAKEFFRGVVSVRLERDDPKEIRGRFARYLAYVFVERDGRWVNYNVEAVRAGMSPYFSKYGYSRRFHDEFVQAQQEARAAERGIWDPEKEHYRDYEQRLAWWDARGDFVAQFERDGEGRDDFIALTNWDAKRRLEAMEGEEVVVLATVGEVYRGDRVSKVLLSRRMGDDFPLVFFDPSVLSKSRIEEYAGEYVRVSGIVASYENKKRRSKELQLVINVASQVRVPDYPLPVGSIALAPSPARTPDGAPAGDTPAAPPAPQEPTQPAQTPSEPSSAPAPESGTSEPRETTLERPPEP